jgi:hypothetical protein
MRSLLTASSKLRDVLIPLPPIQEVILGERLRREVLGLLVRRKRSCRR